VPQFLPYLTGAVWINFFFATDKSFGVHNPSSLEKIRVSGEIKLQVREVPPGKDYGGVAVGETHVKSDPLPAGRDAVNSYSRRQFSSLRWESPEQTANGNPAATGFYGL
jgi:hypothetical protein